MAAQAPVPHGSDRSRVGSTRTGHPIHPVRTGGSHPVYPKMGISLDRGVATLGQIGVGAQ